MPKGGPYCLKPPAPSQSPNDEGGPSTEGGASTEPVDYLNNQSKNPTATTLLDDHEYIDHVHDSLPPDTSSKLSTLITIQL